VKNLRNIPATMRQVADEIERGEHGEVTAAFLIVPVEDDYPQLFGWGVLDACNDPMIQVALCQQWLLNNLVKRR
jgi:hypothetical protein